MCLATYDVTFSNIVSLFPYKNEVYPGWTPRALSISAYTNVSVNNFTAIGDGTFDSTSPAIAVRTAIAGLVESNVPSPIAVKLLTDTFV